MPREGGRKEEREEGSEGGREEGGKAMHVYLYIPLILSVA